MRQVVISLCKNFTFDSSLPGSTVLFEWKSIDPSFELGDVVTDIKITDGNLVNAGLDTSVDRSLVTIIASAPVGTVAGRILTPLASGSLLPWVRLHLEGAPAQLILSVWLILKYA